ncbi:MAG: desulfoferrodoxin [Patescibacteria group bacterium]
MIKLNQIYKCSVCGNIVQVLYAGGGQLVCCGKQMELLEEKTEDVGAEKHVPVIEEIKEGVKVKIGSVPHPMEESHFIEFIEVLTRQGKICRKYLKPGQAPEAEFYVKLEDIEMVREYCNIHGLWKKV